MSLEIENQLLKDDINSLISNHRKFFKMLNHITKENSKIFSSFRDSDITAFLMTVEEIQQDLDLINYRVNGIKEPVSKLSRLDILKQK